MLSATAAQAPSLAASFRDHLVHHTHPPGYGVFLYGWVQLFGASDVALRLSSALAGAASLLVFRRLVGRQFSAPVARTAIVLAALTYPGIYYAHEGRPYTLVLLLSIWTTALWLQVLCGLQEPAPLPRALLAETFVAGLLTAYIHYFGVALVFFQLASLLVLAWRAKRRGDLLALLAVAGGLALLFSPWLPVMASTARGYAGTEGVGRPGLVFLLMWASFVLTNKSLLSALVAVALLAVPAACNWTRFRQRVSQLLCSGQPDGVRARGLVYLALVPLGSLMLVSQHTNVMGFRFLMILCPAVYLLLAIAMAACFEDPEAAPRLALLVCLLALAVEVPKALGPHKEQWREAVGCALAASAPGDDFVAITFPELFEHYFRQAGRPNVLAGVPNDGTALAARLRSCKARGGKSLIVLRARDPGLSPETEEKLRRSSRGEERTELKAATVYRFQL